MFLVWIVFALVVGAAGIYLYTKTIPIYREVVHRVDKITFGMVAAAAVQFGIAGSLLFFAGYFFGVSAMESYTAWTSDEIIGIAASSILPGFVVFLASLYQMYSTRKFRQWMMRRK